MMKKVAKPLIAAVLAAGMILSLSACGKRSGSSSSSSESTSSSSTSVSTSSSSSFIEGQLTVDYTEDMLDNIITKYEINTDTKGWLKVPGTDVDDEVMQSNDNDYYLRRDIYKKYDLYGSYFAHYKSTLGNRDALAANTVIFGHSDLKDNKDGPDFSQMFRFDDLDFMKEHPYIYFSTKEEDMVFQIFGVYYSDCNFNYIKPDPSTQEFTTMLNEIQLRSQFIFPDIEVSSSDKIITLSTCTRKYGSRDDQRFVLAGRLLPKDAVLMETVNVQQNPSPKQPQF